MSKRKKHKKAKTLSKSQLMDKILGQFSNHPSKTLNYKQIAKMLNVHDMHTKRLIVSLLNDLVDQEHLAEVYRGKFKLKSKGGYITGTVDLSSKGYAHIISEDIEDVVFVSKENLNHALHEDKVKVFLYAKRKTRHYEGEVTEVIERAKSTFVGIVEISDNYAFLIPNHKTMPFDIFIPFKQLNKVENGQVAIAEIVDWPMKAKNPVGKIIEVLGNPGENETEIHAILAEFDLPYKFPKNILNAADKIPVEITKTEIKNRRDFRNITTFTIDPEDAKDFDDALSFRKLDNNNYEVGVHIADVTHYLQENSILDKEAYNRATSVYLVDRVVPMLPEKLSNELCSLRPNEDKLCFSAVFEIDENANILNSWFGKTVIHSDRRFNYEEAQEVIISGKGDFADEILILHDLATKLRNLRFNNGSIAFEQAEVKFRLDKSGAPMSVYFKESKESNHLIEEFMLLANKKVAEYIGKAKKGTKPKTFVYRVHDNPDPDKISTFKKFLKKFGYSINPDSKNKLSQSLNKLLVDIQGKKEQNLIEKIAVRAMAKAIYSTKNIGHYGLSFEHYSHFTSPIRRYPDVMVHRILFSYLNDGKSVNEERYEKKCKHSSDMEMTAEKAERASIKYKQVEFMQDKVGKTFEGIISGITEWGIYVEIIENKCEGMIPMRELSDDFYIFDEENYRIVGRHFNKSYQLGDKVKIQVKSANLVKKQLDFIIVDNVDITE
jgi:ribonuclease R